MSDFFSLLILILTDGNSQRQESGNPLEIFYPEEFYIMLQNAFFLQFGDIIQIFFLVFHSEIDDGNLSGSGNTLCRVFDMGFI